MIGTKRTEFSSEDLRIGIMSGCVIVGNNKISKSFIVIQILCISSIYFFD